MSVDVYDYVGNAEMQKDRGYKAFLHDAMFWSNKYGVDFVVYIYNPCEGCLDEYDLGNDNTNERSE